MTNFVHDILGYVTTKLNSTATAANVATSLTTTRISAYGPSSNRITGMTENAAALRTYTYDGAGNIITDVRPGESYAYTYNKRNRLASVTRNAAAYATYGYNALEQLTTRTTTAAGGPTGTIAYVYDLDGHLMVEADSATGATLREYIWLPSNDNRITTAGGRMGETLGLASLAANDNAPPDLPLAIVDTVNTTPTLLMVHSDHLGRPTRLTDATKTTVWQAVYKPWGETQSISGTRTNNLRLPGQYFQIETNLAYNWHRHYDPVTGRYTQPDPLRFVDGPSVYAYAGSSPWVRTDREGLNAICLIDKMCPPGTEGVGEGGYGGIGSAAAGGLTVGALFGAFWEYCMGSSPGNVESSAIRNAWAAAGGPPDKCKWLKENSDKFRADELKATEKAWGCRRSRWNR
jgi:RHS repeat-associated protein